ncbi:MurR/RpiR family transcriptional regulator [Pseudoflavonifractor sp. 60]|uniref:MurR/RpiR family transcriptional regulator n=1 Tax=Pseudoflavonifractor sp. 60 TaxID=2304576 RepID=UPI00136D3E92|nr:MurR/RpiR family transcriptional regulator [Pseudoflavonifractor sp. 60]MCI8547175.1 MurR/RpiR family transcriptional regulator [Clostridia bacterium]NBI67318.1 MurR/RpiR family transcriptional regulator [Pseudoflavonifractor sp. 60]
MFYSKLPIMFLSEMVSSKQDSTNGRIAAYILEHLDEIKNDSIRDLAAKTYVSISSISRFCRDIGLSDYTELKELIASTSLNFEVCSQATTPQGQKEDYIAAVQESLEKVRSSLDMELLYRLAQDIYVYKNVAIFGMLKAETVAMNLQSDLTMLGKVSTTKVRFSEQIDYLSAADADDLIIIFSFTGIYYDYGMPQSHLKRQSKRPKIYFITSDIEAKQSGTHDQVIWFDSKQDQASHPYQLQLIGGLIAQCYAHLLQQTQEQ